MKFLGYMCVFTAVAEGDQYRVPYSATRLEGAHLRRTHLDAN